MVDNKCDGERIPGGGTSEGAVAGEDGLPFEIDVQALRQWRKEGRDFVLVDVREPHEYEICQIEGSVLMPLGRGPDQFEELVSEQLVVIHCHHGPRSSQVVAYLRQKGHSAVTNLAGGIDAWSLLIDPSVSRY
jgi:rhodanese-related sulfurtransferase